MKLKQQTSLLLLLFITCIYATQSFIHLRNKQVIDTEKVASLELNHLVRRSLTSKQFLIKLHAPLHKERLDRVAKRLGTTLEHYIPHHTFVVLVQESKLPSLPDDDVAWIGPVHASYKSTIQFSIPLNTTTTSSFSRLRSSASPVLHETASSPFRLEYLIRLIQPSASAPMWSLCQGWQVESSSETHYVLRYSFTFLIDFVCAKQMIQSIKQDERVLFMELKPPMAMYNSIASQMIQNGVSSLRSSTSTESIRHSIWEQGVTGEGEVVAIGDTGIDHDMCYFGDPNVATPINRVNHNHRKIVAYYPLRVVDATTGQVSQEADDRDDPDGHGTHVAGSVAGKYLYTNQNNQTFLARHNGMAPDAKLCFLDMQKSSDDGSGGLVMPDNLYTGYLPMCYKQANARIHSNSWGCSVANLFACQYDCKCLWARDLAILGVRKGDRASDEWCTDVFGVTRCCEFCNQYNSQAQEVDKFLYDNQDMVILFAAGNNGFISKYGNVVTPGTAKNSISVGATHTMHEQFMTSIDYTDFKPILDLLKMKSTDQCCNDPDYKAFCCPNLIREAMKKNTEYFTKDQLAYFSGRGPTTDKRTKPDIVAPGYNVLSAHSDGNLATKQCGGEGVFPLWDNEAALMSARGTSMSTPIAAGATALVRNYYRKIKGVAKPSGYLVKATLLHSGQKLGGYVRLDPTGAYSQTLNNIAYPNTFAGFGLIQLNQALHFEQTSNFDKRFWDWMPIQQDGDHIYYFQVNAKETQFKATLAWYDAPMSSLADPTMPMLVNDLHLDVYVQQNKDKSDFIHFVGNQGTSSSSGDGYNVLNDQTNTVEQVNATIKSNDAQTYIMVVIRAAKILGSANYALVITYDKNSLTLLTPMPTNSSSIPSGYPSPPSMNQLTVGQRIINWFYSWPAVIWYLIIASCIICPLCIACWMLLMIRRFIVLYRQKQSFGESITDAPVLTSANNDFTSDHTVLLGEFNGDTTQQNNNPNSAVYYR